ncbi:hypothetical protein D1872_257260 [compost metagenome]
MLDDLGQNHIDPFPIVALQKKIDRSERDDIVQLFSRGLPLDLLQQLLVDIDRVIAAFDFTGKRNRVESLPAAHIENRLVKSERASDVVPPLQRRAAKSETYVVAVRLLELRLVFFEPVPGSQKIPYE